MKHTLRLLVFLGSITASLNAVEKQQTMTFYVSGVECGSCVYVVQQSISEMKGVSDATVVQVIDNYANVVFDPKVVSEHQIAQAVREALPIHGKPYLATLKLHVADYAKHVAKVDCLFARWKDWVELETVDKGRGELLIHCNELKNDAKKTGPQGWSLAQFTAAMKSPAPAGLGLDFTLASEGQ
ncbi:heavy-metal-associated domain-containing protein [Prosthecobacter sp.]|uniref:heavy-metal-associated domain-containing protein n=1 Tax=Prosthecobacter sp. TaxID=1965333 RepID=UPI00248A6AD8|nr:heavy-metal-associated domain-containing protein [Prosthecobacter sp.]MDI1311947.1 heavy-metal-associated domain-containing protein [Prosthecobacter sp.]